MDDLESQVKKLRDDIAYHNKMYYDYDSPVISDFDYDMLVLKFKKLTSEHPEFQSYASVLGKIGGHASKKFLPVKHVVKMESLHNSYSYRDMTNFVGKIRSKLDAEFVVEPKIDGLSVSLEYKNGLLIRGSTRGNGEIGEDVTDNVLTIKNLPKKLSQNVPFLEVRGEVFMNTSDFLRFQDLQEKKGEKTFKNPRNAAAGSLRQKYSKVARERNLQIFIFNLQRIKFENKDFELNLHSDSLDYLKNLGLPVVPLAKLARSSEEVLEKINEINVERKKLPFQTDGAVVKVNDFRHRKLLGSTNKFPRWAEAYKFSPEEKSTKLLNIEINVGRTGVLTPVGIFEPVTLSGTAVSRATLHNQDFITKKDIRIHDTVILKKSGEIIPEVVKVVEHQPHSTAYFIPKFCPSCNAGVFRDADTAYVRCINPKCPAQVLRNIIHFVSREAMDINGLGESIVEKLISKNVIHSAVDLYDLKIEDMLFLYKNGTKNSEKIIENIENSKKNNLDKLLFALGIRNVGAKTAKILAEHFGNIHSLMRADFEQISLINGVGKIIAESIVNFFKLPETVNFIKNLEEKGVNLEFFREKSEESYQNKFFGKNFVLTGSLENFSRIEAREALEKLGAKVISSVSKNTDYLIFGESPGSKLEKAKELGIKILNETEFLKMLENF